MQSETVDGVPDPETEAELEWRASDLEFIRVMEDLTETLIAKGVLAESDLPATAQTKLNARRALREG